MVPKFQSQGPCLETEGAMPEEVDASRGGRLFDAAKDDQSERELEDQMMTDVTQHNEELTSEVDRL